MNTKQIADNMLHAAMDNVYGTVFRKTHSQDQHFWIAVALFQHAYNLYDAIYCRTGLFMDTKNNNRAYCTVSRLREKLRENS